MAIIAGGGRPAVAIADAERGHVGSLIGLASLGTSLAYIVFFPIMNRSGATNVMLVTR